MRPHQGPQPQRVLLDLESFLTFQRWKPSRNFILCICWSTVIASIEDFTLSAPHSYSFALLLLPILVTFYSTSPLLYSSDTVSHGLDTSSLRKISLQLSRNPLGALWEAGSCTRICGQASSHSEIIIYQISF